MTDNRVTVQYKGVLIKPARNNKWYVTSHSEKEIYDTLRAAKVDITKFLKYGE